MSKKQDLIKYINETHDTFELGTIVEYKSSKILDEAFTKLENTFSKSVELNSYNHMGQLGLLSACPGVYRLMYGEKVFYVGSSTKDMSNRTNSHKLDIERKDKKFMYVWDGMVIGQLKPELLTVQYRPTSDYMAPAFEKWLINKYQPACNSAGTLKTAVTKKNDSDGEKS